MLHFWVNTFCHSKLTPDVISKGSLHVEKCFISSCLINVAEVLCHSPHGQESSLWLLTLTRYSQGTFVRG